jgi:hypothetical protein
VLFGVEGKRSGPSVTPGAQTPTRRVTPMHFVDTILSCASVWPAGLACAVRARGGAWEG